MYPNLAPLANIVLFIMIFVVMRLADCVVVYPLYTSVSPPTVRQAWCTSALLGWMEHSSFPYVTFLPDGSSVSGMKKIVFVSFGLPEIPWASLQRLFPYDFFHVVLLVLQRRAGYCSRLPVSSFNTAHATAYLEQRLKCLGVDGSCFGGRR